MALPKPTAVLLVVVMIVASSHLQSTMGATTHIVGDNLGWTIPLTNGADTYTTWASQRTFSIGDTLVFNFTTGFHTVAEVSQAATSDPCTATSTLSVNPVSPVTITLTSPGTHQYICTIIGHCQLGQKLTIYVSPAAGTPQSAPILSPPSSIVTPPFTFGLSPVGSPIPLPWSASPAFAAVVPYTFLALALAFFY